MAKIGDFGRLTIPKVHSGWSKKATIEDDVGIVY